MDTVFASAARPLMLDPRAPGGRAAVLWQAERDADPALVAISDAAIASTAWSDDMLAPAWVELPPCIADAPDAGAALPFLLIAGALFYRFWRLDSDGGLGRYHAHGERGSRALWAACVAAWGDDATPATFRATYTKDGVAGVFGDIPDAPGRKRIIDELLAGMDGVASATAYCVERMPRGPAVSVGQAQYLAETFPWAFGDPYLKKAQLVLAMYAHHCARRGMPVEVSNLTAFADYQVPRVLRALGVLRYAPVLAHKIDARQPLPPGGAEERAIRSATILACEKIAARQGCTAAGVDNILWSSQELAGDTPFHLCATTAY